MSRCITGIYIILACFQKIFTNSFSVSYSSDDFILRYWKCDHAFLALYRDLDIYTEMDEFIEMSKVSSCRCFVIDICFMSCSVFFFGNWKVLIFFLFSPAGNVLLTEDGTVKLGKALGCFLVHYFSFDWLYLTSPSCVFTGIFKNDNERIRQ